MAKLEPRTFDINTINGGNRFREGDTPTPETFNAPVEAAALMQSLGLNQPDNSRAHLVGNPNVSIDTQNHRFVFSALKGEKGEKGDTGERGASGTSAVLENENHNSNIDGYTQNFVNSNFSNPNLLINGDFKINQRGQTIYNGAVYTVDRWKLSNAECSCEKMSDGLGIKLKAPSSSNAFLLQFIEDGFYLLQGKTVTFSTKINGIVYYATGTVPTSLNATGTQPIARISSPNSSVISTGLYLTTSGSLYVQLGTVAHSENVINWAKLEIGSVATPLSPRPMAEELLLCQRYYQKITSNVTYGTYGIGTALARNTDDSGAYNIHFPISLLVPMRASGSIIIDGSLSLVSKGRWFNGFTQDDLFGGQGASSNNRILLFYLKPQDYYPNETTDYLGDTFILRSDNSIEPQRVSSIIFDAELYG